MTELPESPNLAGKSVAIVGPAKPIGDQSTEVNACDFVIRCNYRWNGHEHLPGYGRKTDAAFFSTMGAKSALDYPELWSHLPYILVKHGGRNMSHPRTIHIPPPFETANQIPYLLSWLEGQHLREIHIFGADFYTGGPKRFHQAAYTPGTATMGEMFGFINHHDQGLNHRWMLDFQARTDLIKGDSRMVELLSISTVELTDRLRHAWREYSG